MSRRKKKGVGINLHYLGGAVSILAFLIVMAFLWSSRNPINPITGCSVNASRLQNTYTFLLDTSDSLSEVQLRKIRNLIESLISTTATEDRFQIFLMGDTEESALDAIFDRCHSTQNISESPALDRFRRIDFESSIFSAVENVNDASVSPILQSVNAVSTSVPRDSSEKHLIIVSDFYEHSSIFSLYNISIQRALIEREREITSSLPDLTGVNVYMQVIDRPDLIQDGQFIEGWISIFRKTGATLRSRIIGTPGNEVSLDVAMRVT